MFLFISQSSYVRAPNKPPLCPHPPLTYSPLASSTSLSITHPLLIPRFLYLTPSHHPLFAHPNFLHPFHFSSPTPFPIPFPSLFPPTCPHSLSRPLFPHLSSFSFSSPFPHLSPFPFPSPISFSLTYLLFLHPSPFPSPIPHPNPYPSLPHPASLPSPIPFSRTHPFPHPSRFPSPIPLYTNLVNKKQLPINEQIAVLDAGKESAEESTGATGDTEEEPPSAGTICTYIPRYKAFIKDFFSN